MQITPETEMRFFHSGEMKLHVNAALQSSQNTKTINYIKLNEICSVFYLKYMFEKDINLDTLATKPKNFAHAHK